MPRKNIFREGKLTLDYDGTFFVLKKRNNPSGTNYDIRGAYNLATNIEREMQKSEHKMEYCLKDFIVTGEAKRLIEAYKRKVKEHDSPTQSRLETLTEKD